MAAGRHNLTRRALLGAGAALPVALAARAAAATAPGGARLAWDRAAAAFRRAEAALDAFRAWEATLPAAERAFPACEPLEQRFNDLECDRLAALRRLLRAAAPDLQAFALKIALAVDNQAWELTGADDSLAALKADARRLCRGG